MLKDTQVYNLSIVLKMFSLMLVLSAVAPRQAQGQDHDPQYVLLSDNVVAGRLPAIETGATYTAEPAPDNPADTFQNSETPGARLQDDDKPWRDWHTVVGWNGGTPEITFDLKAIYRPAMIEFLVEDPEAVASLTIDVRKTEDGEWHRAAAGERAQTDWTAVELDDIRDARYVRIRFALARTPFYLREVRIFGLTQYDSLEQVDEEGLSDGERLTLVSDGKARGAIVVAREASRKAATSARILQKYFFEMTGVMVPVLVDDQPLPQRQLRVGPAAASDLKHDVQQVYPGHEGYHIERQDDVLYILGNDAQHYSGTMMAACDLLKMLGARYYRYDDPLYQIVPKRQDVVFGDIRRSERPRFEHRNISTYSAPTHRNEANMWRVWNRVGGVSISTSHNDLIDKALYKEHPEYFALIDGKRVDPTRAMQWQVCTTHPKVVELAADAAAKWFESEPAIQSFSLSPRDTGGYCQCGACLEVDAIYGSNMAARWAVFANAVRASLDARYPQYSDRYLIFYAYWYTKMPPARVELSKGVVPMLVGDGDHLHRWENSASRRNRRLMNMFQGWRMASQEPVAIYEWYIPGISDPLWERFPWGRYSNIFDDQKTWEDHGVSWAYYEAEQAMEQWKYRWVPYNVLAEGLWGSKGSEAEIVKDMCERLYGSASRPMSAYYQLLDAALRRSKLEGETWKLPDPRNIYDEETRQRAQGLLAQALELVPEESDEYARVVDAVTAWDEGWANLEDTGKSSPNEGGYNPHIQDAP